MVVFFAIAMRARLAWFFIFSAGAFFLFVGAFALLTFGAFARSEAKSRS
jgi:hypothetical protein